MNKHSQFKENGFIVHKNVLKTPEVEKYINILNSFFEEKEEVVRNGKKIGNTGPNGVIENEQLWDILFNEKILSLVKQSLGESIKFLQHNDIHRNFSASGWHRDSATRTYSNEGDWDTTSPYKIVRVGIYLQKFEKSKFRLGIIRGTNKKKVGILEQKSLVGKVIRAIEKLAAPILGWNYSFPFLGRCEYKKLEDGDIIIFDPRLFHRGTKSAEFKHSIFVAYGIENNHFKRHANYYLNERKDLGYSTMPQKLIERLEEKDLLASFYKKNK